VQNSMAPHPARDYVVLRWDIPDWLLWQRWLNLRTSLYVNQILQDSLHY
jgi:hypothetical protein